MNKKVLLVDEDAKFIGEINRLSQEEFHIVTALGSDQGMRILADQGPFAIVVSALHMYGTNGVQFLSRIKRSSPHAVGILLLGPDDFETGMEAVTSGNIAKFLTKPLKPHMLITALKCGMEQYFENCLSEKKEEKNRSPVLSRKVLIVDDDPIVRSIISSELRKHPDISILTAENGKVATTLLNLIKIDLVITDLEMPVMNGLELLSHMKHHHSDTPVILLTWCLKEEIEKKINSLGYFQYLEKPLKGEELTGLVLEELNSKKVAQVLGIGTSTFMQLIEIEEKTCTLTVKHKQGVGKLYFLKGGLIDAETDKMKGANAAYEIIGWEGGVIEIEQNCPKRDKVINQSLMMILLEANKLLDERRTGNLGVNESPADN